MSGRKCNCTPRQFRTNRVVCKDAVSGLPCSVNAATLAKPASTGKTGIRGDDQICPSRPYRSALRNQLNPQLSTRVRHASNYWAQNKKRPGLTQTSLNSIAVKRVFFPNPPKPEGAPRELPQLYWQAPQVIIPEGTRCGNFGRNCVIPREHQMRLLAEEVAKMRNNNVELPRDCAPVLDYSLCL